MKAQVHLPSDLWNEAMQLAMHEAFPEVVRILRTFKEESSELTEAEASHLLDFARFLLQRAELNYPYWNDAARPYSPEHEDAFQEINMGLHEKLFSHIGSAFPDLIK